MQLFLTAFESVPDPRAENSRYDLVEILLIAFLAVLCGAQHCSEMAEFGCAKLKLSCADFTNTFSAETNKIFRGFFINYQSEISNRA